jgi:putative lipoic acid-binding regulatory protein
MANPDWPTNLDVQPLADAYDEQLPRVAIRTAMDAGPAKVRRKLSNNSRFVTVELSLTATEVGYFDTFFMTTLLGGVLRFDWVHPRTLAAIESRIMVDESQGPSYRDREGLFLVDFVLEILP